MAMAARMPMIATTIISSIRVKPRWLPRFRRRLFQNRSIRFSFVVYVPSRLRSHAPAFRGGASLDAGREGVRRSAGLRRTECDETTGARFQGNEASVADFARRRYPGGSRVVDENEPVKNFIAVELVVVLDPHDAGRVEVEFGQPALREREEHEDEEQDCERYLLAAEECTHGSRLSEQFPCQRYLPADSMPYVSPYFRMVTLVGRG